ncbi:SAVED domain-containing protein [Pseudothermotoga sp.]
MKVTYHHSFFLANRSDEYLRLVRSGVLSREKLLKDFELLSKDHQNRKLIFYEVFKLFLQDKDHASAALLLSKEYSLSFEQSMRVVLSDHKEVKFPVVARESSDVRRALVFNSNLEFCDSSEHTPKLRIIERLVGFELSVLFDGDFCGDSFMLAVAVGALSKNLPIHVAFSGCLDEHGNVGLVENLERKFEVCSKHGLELLTAFDAQNFRELVDFFNSREHHVPMYLCYKHSERVEDRGWEELKTTVESSFPTKSLDLYRKIHRVEMIHRRHMLREDEYASELRRAFETLQVVFQSGGVPHLAINGPASFAMALGIVVGAKRRIAVYHYQGGYHLVLDLTKSENLRKIKALKREDELKLLEYELLGDGEEVAFVIHLASHDPLPQVKEFLKNRDVLIAYVRSKQLGMLKIGDWTEYVCELFSVTQIVKRRRSYRGASFFLSCPVAIAFGFGMSFGDYTNGKIYQYDAASSSYVPVFEIEDLSRKVLSNF